MLRKVSVCLFVLGLFFSTGATAQITFGTDIEEPTGEVIPIEGLQEIAIDDITWDYTVLQSPRDETRTNLNPAAAAGYRLYGPGQARWGSAKFTTSTLGGSKELQAWWQEAAKGKGIRKNITVTLFKSDKSPGRSYTLFDCFPTQWSSVNFDTSSTVQTETLTVNIGSIHFDAREQQPPRKGDKKLTAALDGNPMAIQSWGDGDMNLIVEGPLNAAKFRTISPGRKSVNEITLRGAMTDGRKALCHWINDAVSGKPWRQSLTITEMLSVDGGVKDGKQYIYQDCFPVRYVFPRMSVTNTTGNTMEEVTVKPIRLELK